MKVYYEHYEKKPEDYTVTNYFNAKEVPKWWKELTPFINGYKSLKEFFKKNGLYGSGEGFPITAKICPSLNLLFKNSIQVKSPAEIYIECDESGWCWKSSNSEITIVEHPNEQAPKYLGEKYFFIKFVFPFRYATNENCSLVIQDPILYNQAAYRICPAVTKINANTPMQMNIIALLEKPKERTIYHINFGDTLALLSYSKEINSLTHKKLPKNTYEIRKTFLGAYKKIWNL
jgi:hypothetical protein